ncbi:translation initiation factor, partial [Scytonema tolypothrichoides VB-61278]
MVDDFLRRATDFIVGSNEDDSFAAARSADREVRPATEDPYGDPADQDYYSNAIPASQDPYGDPADQDYYSNAIPASQDP